MSHWIPKEKMTAYQRWEVAAFDEEQRATVNPPPPAEPPVAEQPIDVPVESASVPQEQEPPVVLPTAEDIERMHQEAHAAGHAAGYAEGMVAGKAAAVKIAALMDSLQQALAAIDQGVADQ